MDKPKFNIGEKAYAIRYNKPTEVVVKGVQLYDKKSYVYYTRERSGLDVYPQGYILEDALFRTKEELVNSLWENE